ncbi:MAG: glycosyltransferase family A protein, partial [Ruthenibacterium sp.]
MTDHNNTQRAVSPQGVSGGENALVSIIIPVYNAAPHLARCIESVRRQTYRNLEILLINDGCSDTSGPICRMYARVDARIHVTDKDNSGVSATRNLALRPARGKYIQVVDSDE